MVPERLVFWMAPIEDEPDTDGGVICQRHADRLVVPRGWTLDDRRDPTLRLFRPPEGSGAAAPSARRTSRRKSADATEQLPLPGEVAAPVHEQPADEVADSVAASGDPEVSVTARPAWAPSSGVSEASEDEVKSSLLARAFGLRRRG